MESFPIPSSKNRDRNERLSAPAGWVPCLVCCKPLNPEKAVQVNVGYGGCAILTPEEARKEQESNPGANLGLLWVGPECAKKIPKRFHVRS